MLFNYDRTWTSEDSDVPSERPKTIGKRVGGLIVFQEID